MQVASLGGAGADLLASGGGRYVAPPGGEGPKDRIEVPDDRLFAADHHAIAPLQTPDPAAGSDIDVVDPPRRQLLGAPNVVDVVGITPIDQDVVRLEGGQNVGDRLIDDGRRNHQPNRPRLLQLLYEVGKRGGSDRVLRGQLAHRLRRHVEDHAFMASLEEAPHHVGAHPAQAYHSELHRGSLSKQAQEDFLTNAAKSKERRSPTRSTVRSAAGNEATTAASLAY